MQTNFRLGSTSFVIPADILPNVRHLGPLVDDIELVLFEVDDNNNLPTEDVILELDGLAKEHDLTYTVHLPLDLKLADAQDEWRHPSMEKARRVIRSTLPLEPWAYIVHLDGVEIENSPPPNVIDRWQRQAIRSLRAIIQEVKNPQLIAIENLENYDPHSLVPILDQLPVSLCLDVGHFYKNEQDPMPFLTQHLHRTRVMHLHGSSEGRDHRGLNLIPQTRLKDLIDTLLVENYQGVLTLEVFTERHFYPGRDQVLALVEEWYNHQ